ncbi:MAG: flagellar motor switch protein FliN [Bacillota bacterium]
MSENGKERVTEIQKAEFPEVERRLPSGQVQKIDLLYDVPLEVTVEIGRTRRLLKEVLGFTQGSVVELEKSAGDPVDVFINGRLVARGEVVVVDENFGVRITEVVGGGRDANGGAEQGVGS